MREAFISRNIKENQLWRTPVGRDLGCINTATKLLTNFHFTTINHVQ